MLYGDGQTHEKYEFSLNADGTDYDWDHATNVDTGDQITLAPEDGDTDAQAALDAFHEDNNCYTIEDVDGNTVTDPQGILYMTANSASGSKYYELLSTQQDYVAARSQNWLPSYSVITMTADSFSIDTYQITDDGKAEAIDDTFIRCLSKLRILKSYDSHQLYRTTFQKKSGPVSYLFTICLCVRCFCLQA